MKTCVRTGVSAALLTILLLAVLSPRLEAQQNSATLSGTVLDSSGAGVRNAAVVATNEASNQVSKVTTDQQGHFTVSGLTPGRYTLEVSAPGFAADTRNSLEVTSDKNQELAITLKIGSVSEVVTVEANDSDSVAAHLAPMDSLLDERSARTEIKSVFIQNFTAPTADFGELVEMAPGTFSIDPNGVGLGQDKTYFRGFPDGDYDIDFDGLPFYDTNTPTHHTWAFFPSPWVGGVDFDRSPGTASTIGPTPFGGSIHLLSPELKNDPIIAFGVTYGSFNTKLYDGTFDSGKFGPGGKSNMMVDVQHMTSNGYETENFQIRNAGALKYQYKFSDTNVLTGFSGVVWLDSNTPNANPTRGQIAAFGDNFLIVNDPNAAELNSVTTKNPCVLTNGCFYPLNYRFYTYHVPTDFEYVGWTKQWGRGWQTDFRPYTLSYYNAQYYNNPKFASDGVTFTTTVTPTSAVDKLNSYRKYGENFVVSQVSKVGIFRAGLWYEWATTNRYQIPSNPVNLVDAALPNFHENFNTNSYQPFAEYEYHVTQRLTVTGGFKFGYFNQNLTQFQDNGKTVGCLGGKLTGSGATQTCAGGLGSVNHSAGYNSYMPSADANFRIRSNWSVYGQYGTGTIVPPSGVFDVAGANVAILPKPTGVYTFQGGTVYKVKQLTINGDYYYTHYQNAYSSINDPNNTSEFDQVAQGDAVSRGFEGEANFYLLRGLSFYINGTVGQAKYVSQNVPLIASNGVVGPNPDYNRWVQNTPSDTEAFGLTYQQRHFEVGIFDKRVGDMWNDLSVTLPTGATGTANQIIPIAPFSVTNIYFNYVLANHSHFRETKLRLSVNNLFDNHNIVGVTQAAASFATIAAAKYSPGGADQVSLLPGRSIAATITVGYSPRGQ